MKALLGMVRGTWPVFGQTGAEDLIRMWMMVLGGQSLEDATKALATYVARGPEYPPNPGQLLQRIERAHGNAPEDRAAKAYQQAVRLVERAGNLRISSKGKPAAINQVVERLGGWETFRDGHRFMRKEFLEVAIELDLLARSGFDVAETPSLPAGFSPALPEGGTQ